MQKAEQIPKGIEKELTLLRGFKDLVAERTGYYFGTKVLGKKMSEETKTQRGAVSKAGKKLKEGIELLIEQPTAKNSKTVQTATREVKEAKKTNRKAREPHMKKISPLRKATRYIDTVAIPDSLKELGKPVTPRFSLSDWATKAIA